MMLSKKEYKYRCKIIAENHLKKDIQKYLDEYIKSKSLTYKYIYLSSINIRVQYLFDKMSVAMKTTATSFKKVANSFKEFTSSIEKLSKVVNA